MQEQRLHQVAWMDAKRRYVYPESICYTDFAEALQSARNRAYDRRLPEKDAAYCVITTGAEITFVPDEPERDQTPDEAWLVRAYHLQQLLSAVVSWLPDDELEVMFERIPLLKRWYSEEKSIGLEEAMAAGWKP